MRTGLLAIATAIAWSTAPAAALDLARPTETVRACPGHGPGFFLLPGTTTCLRIAGRVRAEAGTSSRRVARESLAGFGASGAVSFDARTDTAYGPFRTFVRLKAGDMTGRGTQAYVTTP